jgi:hypothetical protein
MKIPRQYWRDGNHAIFGQSLAITYVTQAESFDQVVLSRSRPEWSPSNQRKWLLMGLAFAANLKQAWWLFPSAVI